MVSRGVGAESGGRLLRALEHRLAAERGPAARASVRTPRGDPPRNGRNGRLQTLSVLACRRYSRRAPREGGLLSPGFCVVGGAFPQVSGGCTRGISHCPPYTKRNKRNVLHG